MLWPLSLLFRGLRSSSHWRHALVRQGQLDEAIVHLSKGVTQKPGPLDAHVALARAFTAQGKKIEAEQHHYEALRLLKSAKQIQPAQ
jgi:Tfp pilus assembly protein PilF